MLQPCTNTSIRQSAASAASRNVSSQHQHASSNNSQQQLDVVAEAGLPATNCVLCNEGRATYLQKHVGVASHMMSQSLVTSAAVHSNCIMGGRGGGSAWLVTGSPVWGQLLRKSNLCFLPDFP